MALSKLGIYVILFGCLFTGVLQEYFVFYYILLGIILVDCKDNNVRSLLGIIILMSYILYEVNYLIYFLTAFVFQTGKVWGDLLNNAWLILCYFMLINAIFFRQEITSSAMRLLKIGSIEYLPTRSDVIQIYIARIMMIYCSLYTVYMSYLAYIYFQALEGQSNILMEEAMYDFSKASNDFVQFLSYLGTVKLITLAFTTHRWAQMRMGKSRPKYKMKA